VEFQEYQESQELTALQTKKIGLKDMIPGCSYRTKKAEDIIYMGRFDWYEMDYDKTQKERYRYSRDTIETVRPKQHVFYRKDHYQEFFPLSSLSTIASINSDVPVSNYADLMEKFNLMEQASHTIGLESKSYIFETDGGEKNITGWGNMKLKNGEPFLKQEDGSYLRCQIHPERQYDSKTSTYKFLGYKVNGYQVYSHQNGILRIKSGESQYYGGFVEQKNSWEAKKQRIFTEEEVKSIPFVKLFQVQSNGKKIKIK
jgi:hypothetical protein